MQKPGFILIITFMMLSFALANVILIFNVQYHHSSMMGTLVYKCKTLEAALTAPDFLKGILNACITHEKSKEQKQEKTKTASSSEDSLKILSCILNASQTMQEVAISWEKEEGVPIKYACMLGCEEGKLNLNSIYNFSKSEWQTPQKKAFCKWLFQAIAKYTKTDSLFEPFEKYLKNRGAYFNDVTELFQIKEFRQVFSEGIMPSTLEKDSRLYLGELFTVWTDKDTINCVGLSRSFALLIGAKQENMIELLQQKEKIQEIVKLSSQGAQGLATFFDKVYGIELNSMPQDFKSLLTMNFELNIFSIVLTASVQKITSTVFAIIKRQTSFGTDVTYDVMKVYQV